MMLPGVHEAMLKPDFWVERLDWLDRPTNERFSVNREHCADTLRSQCRELVDILGVAAEFLKRFDVDVFERWLTLPDVDERSLYDEKRRQWDASLWDAVVENASFSKRDLDVRFGVTVCQASVRRWPTSSGAFRTLGDLEFDQFQETALHTFEPIIILANSRDGRWRYVVSETYAGWVQAQNIAIVDWPDFLRYAELCYAQPKRMVVVTNPHVTTQANPYDAAVSKRWIEMGAYLPIVNDSPMDVGGQSCVGHIPVQWPIRGDDGSLQVHTALVSAHFGIHVGFVPFSRQAVIRAAFELLTERYGWGDSFGNHDCSSLVMDVYRTVGIQLPRDTGAQERASAHRVEIPPAATAADRIRVIERLGPGTPLYMPGHTMIYLGEVHGRHYVIHAFSGYMDETSGDDVFVPVNEVMVSTLDIRSSKGTTYLEALTGALDLFGLPA